MKVGALIVGLMTAKQVIGFIFALSGKLVTVMKSAAL
jgi:hypothetical protein